MSLCVRNNEFISLLRFIECIYIGNPHVMEKQKEKPINVRSETSKRADWHSHISLVFADHHR